jgi:hypothetical protein
MLFVLHAGGVGVSWRVMATKREGSPVLRDESLGALDALDHRIPGRRAKDGTIEARVSARRRGRRPDLTNERLPSASSARATACSRSWMTARFEDADCVATWVARSVDGRPAKRKLAMFERALAALWRRAQPTLGDVTLAALVERVLYTAAEQHALIAALKVRANGVDLGALRARAGELDEKEIAASLRAVLVDLLALLGSLTAGILAPGLRTELSNVALREPAEAGRTPPGDRHRRRARQKSGRDTDAHDHLTTPRVR